MIIKIIDIIIAALMRNFVFFLDFLELLFLLR